MESARITGLLEPFLRSGEHLATGELDNISTYIDLLLRWNARINLTAIRQPEEIVTRHFGESLFAARHLFPRVARAPSPAKTSPTDVHRVIDIGSGAGFPGLPIKIWAPNIHLTLIESNQKKATFLRELIRAITLTSIDVFSGRAEDFPNPPAQIVALRAVERFGTILPIAASLVTPKGRLALLIGSTQLASARDLTPDFTWSQPVGIPLSSNRCLVIGTNNREQPAPGK
jgi:16S rRNA (guanine527-N7)-methyltransferase